MVVNFPFAQINLICERKVNDVKVSFYLIDGRSLDFAIPVTIEGNEYDNEYLIRNSLSAKNRTFVTIKDEKQSVCLRTSAIIGFEIA